MISKQELKENNKFYDRLFSLPEEEREQYFRHYKSILKEEKKNHRLINEGETVQDFMREHGYVDGTALRQRMKDICNTYTPNKPKKN